MQSTDLTLLPFFGEDVAYKSFLKNFLFDQEMPKASDGEGLMVLCPGWTEKQQKEQSDFFPQILLLHNQKKQSV